MRREKLIQNIGQLYLLQPLPHFLDRRGRATPRRDPWRLEAVSDDAARLKNKRTNQAVEIGLDSIYGYGADPQAKNTGELHTGILQLKVQLTVDGNEITVLATARPGEALFPVGGFAPVEITFEEFELRGTTAFRMLWGRRSGDLWKAIAERVKEFDRRESNQVGSAGYVARLHRLLEEDIAVASTATVACALQVLEKFEEPVDKQIESLVVKLTASAFLTFCDGLAGFVARHVSRYGLRQHPDPSELATARALGEVYVLNTVRQHFQSERNHS